jgi:hypothetical protein
MSKMEREKMNHQVKVVCDNCNKDIKVMTKELFYDSKTKLRVEGFECPKCGAVYVTLISDNKLRAQIHRLQEKQAALRQQVKRQGYDYQFYETNDRSIPQAIVRRWQKKIMTLKKEIDMMIDRNKKYEAVLKEKYLEQEGEVRDYVYSKVK